MVKFLNGFLKDEEGATAIEYGLIAALVGVFLVGGLQVLGTGIDGIFRDIADRLGDAAPSGG